MVYIMSGDEKEIVRENVGNNNGLPLHVEVKMKGEFKPYGFLNDGRLKENYFNTNHETDTFFQNYPEALIYSTNDCGCMDVTKEGYVFSIDPNKKEVQLLLTRYNRDTTGGIVNKNGVEEHISKQINLSETFYAANVQSYDEGWKKMDTGVSVRFNAVGENLEVSLFFNDNVSGKDTKLKFTYAKNTDGSYIVTPEKAEILSHKENNPNAAKVEFPLRYETGNYTEVKKTEIINTKITVSEFEILTTDARADLKNVPIISLSKQANPLFEAIMQQMYPEGGASENSLLESARDLAINPNSLLPKKPVQMVGDKGNILNKI